MRIGGRNYRVDWGHLIVATTIAVLCLAYLLDARRTSLDIQNLLLVQPLALFALLMYLLILPQCFKPEVEVEEEPVPPPQQPLGNDAAIRSASTSRSGCSAPSRCSSAANAGPCRC
jgi:hypothetical protein